MGPVRFISLLEDEKRSLQSQLSSLTNKLADGESSKGAVQQLKKSLEAELQDLRDQLAEANRLRLAAEKDKKVALVHPRAESHGPPGRMASLDG